MSSNEAKLSANQRFAAAFERLKLGTSTLLPRGTLVSQNNVAKEAGCDPSALKKNRFPSLIAEIQHYVETHKADVPDSKRQLMLKKRRRNRDTKEMIYDLKRQRDISAGLIADANLLIVDMSEEISDLRRKLDELMPSAATIPFSKPRNE